MSSHYIIIKIDSQISTDLTSTSDDLIESFKVILSSCNGDLQTLNSLERLLSDEIERSSSSAKSSISNATFVPIAKQGEVIVDEDLGIESTPNLDAITQHPKKVEESKVTIRDPELDMLVDFRHEHYSVDRLQEVQFDIDKLFNSGQNCKYVWLSKHRCTYEFGSRALKSQNIDHSEHITSMMDDLNREFNFQLDSCLITRYKAAGDIISRHQDNECIIDQHHAICNISMGSSREIEFWSTGKEGTGMLVKQIFMQEGSLVIMQPGCQQRLWHKVLEGEAGTRFCLSFRHYNAVCEPESPKVLSIPKAQSTPIPVQPTTSKKSNGRTNNPKVPPKSNSVAHHHLVLGDSLVKGLNLKDTIHICKGGIHPDQVLQLLPNFTDVLPTKDYDKVLTVTLVVGTNALNVSGHSDPKPLLDVFNDYNKLINDLKLIFPKARIGLFNVIPRAYSCRETLFRIEQFNTFFSEHVANHMENTFWIRLYWEFVDSRGYLKQYLYGKKGVHLSYRGKQLMGNTIKNFQYSYYYY